MKKGIFIEARLWCAELVGSVHWVTLNHVLMKARLRKCDLLPTRSSCRRCRWRNSDDESLLHHRRASQVKSVYVVLTMPELAKWIFTHIFPKQTSGQASLIDAISLSQMEIKRFKLKPILELTSMRIEATYRPISCRARLDWSWMAVRCWFRIRNSLFVRIRSSLFINREAGKPVTIKLVLKQKGI